MIKILYVISVILLFVISILIRKKEEKIDIITTFFVKIILFTCYNVIISMLFTLINLNINLFSLSIPNYIIIIYLVYKLLKQRKLQKYFIRKKDIFAILIITLICLGISYINFGFPFDISYVQVDASNHYGMITNFFETEKIDIASIPGAYVNYGIIFKLFFNLANKFDGYNIFIVLEIIKLAFSGILFYLTISKFIKKPITYIIGVLISAVYMIGYPLNGTFCGFVYLQMAINIVNTILIIMINYRKIDNKTKNILLFILNFGLMFTYYILVPPVFVAVFLYELKQFKNNKLQTIKNILLIFLIVCIAGISFYILPSLINPQNNFNPTTYMAAQSSYDAYIFVSYWATFIFFVPFNVLYLIIKIRKKQVDFMSIMLISNILYIVFALILKHFGIVARYYVMKPYYMLWLIMLIITAKLIINILNENIEKTYKYMINIVFFTYIAFLIIFTIDSPCSFKVFEHEKETIHSMYNIFRLNRGVIMHETFEIIYTKDELKTLKQKTEKFEENAKIIYLEDGLNKEWLRRILLINDDDYENKYITMNELRKDNVIQEYLINTDEKVYVICYRNLFIEKYYSNIIEKLNENMNNISENGKLIIYCNK